MLRSAVGATSTAAVELLLPGCGSVVPDVSVAVFDSVPGVVAVTVATIVTVASAPPASEPRLHETAVVQVPWLGVADTTS